MYGNLKFNDLHHFMLITANSYTITKKYTCIENFDNTTVDLRSMLITS